MFISLQDDAILVEYKLKKQIVEGKKLFFQIRILDKSQFRSENSKREMQKSRFTFEVDF